MKPTKSSLIKKNNKNVWLVWSKAQNKIKWSLFQDSVESRHTCFLNWVWFNLRFMSNFLLKKKAIKLINLTKHDEIFWQFSSGLSFCFLDLGLQLLNSYSRKKKKRERKSFDGGTSKVWPPFHFVQLVGWWRTWTRADGKRTSSLWNLNFQTPWKEPRRAVSQQCRQ